MSNMTLDQALAASTDGNLITPVNDFLMVDPETRLISVPESEENFGTYNDNDFARKHFKCPRIVQDNKDLSACEIFINYVSANGKPGQYRCEDVEVTEDGNYITFSWELKRNVFDQNKDSTIYFAVQAKKINGGNVFNTRKAQGKCYETVDATEEIAEEHADVIVQLMEEIANLRNAVKSLINKFDPAGLYDDDGNLVCSYDDLMDVYGLDAAKDYTKETYLTDPQSGYNVLQKPELSGAAKLVIDTDRIGKYAFCECTSLRNVEIRCAETIGDAAFNKCSNLEEVFMADSVRTIENAMFQYCENLKECTIPKSVTTIEGYMFNKCTNLETVVMRENPDRVINSKSMFSGCTSLKNITLSGKITNDNKSTGFMFDHCSALGCVDLSECDFTEIESTRAMLQACGSLTDARFPKNFVVSDYTINHCPVLCKSEEFYIPADWKLLDAHPQEGHIFYDFATHPTYKHKRFAVDGNNQYFKTDEYGALYTKDGTSLLSLPNYMDVENGRYEMAEGVTTLWLMSFNRNQTVNTLCIPNSLILSEEKSTSVQGKPETYPNHKNNLTVATHLFTNIRYFDCKPDHPYHSAYGGGIYSKDYTKLITMPIDYVGVFEVKDGCTTICGDAFRYDYGPSDITGLTQVNIPASVTDIKEYNLNKLNTLTQVVKVVDADNPVYKVIDNVIVLKTAQPIPDAAIEIYETEKLPYDNGSGVDTGKVIARFYCKVEYVGKVLSAGIIWCTKEDIPLVVDGNENPDESVKITYASSVSSAVSPGWSTWSISINGIPIDRFVRAVAFAVYDDANGVRHTVFSGEKRITNDGTTTAQSEPSTMRMIQRDMSDTEGSVKWE